jgi:hypothetical protein
VGLKVSFVLECWIIFQMIKSDVVNVMSENVIQYGGLVSVKWQNISIISVLSFS